MSIIFISDLHLSQENHKTRHCFFEFLRTNQPEKLYILGDFFEAWIGDDYSAPWIEEIAAALKNLNSKIYLMQGNRDFLLGKIFAQKCGAELLPDPIVIDLYGTPTLLTHGDILCTEDKNYQKWRKFAHNRLIQWIFLRFSINFRLKIAKNIRNQSKNNKMIVDVTPTAVGSMVSRYQACQVIHGHTHLPAIHHEKAYIRYVLPDWHPKGGMLIVEPSEAPKLVNFE